MGSEFLLALVEATLATSLALLAVMALRRPLRRFAGARLAYAAWAAVPLAGVAVMLPAAPAATVAMAVTPSPLRLAAADASLVLQQAGAGNPWLALWLAGVVATAAVFALRQWRFHRQLGVRDSDGEDDSAPLGPAVIGLWRPRLVLPTDFTRRYSPEEQALVLEHERQHLQRGDLPAQALCSLLRCLFWFNPLLHAAAARFRLDQELACDAAVLARHPDARRRYGEVMLKTQLADFGLPLGCHWQSSHPLKERIAMLKSPLPSAGRARVASALIAASMALATFGAWAVQPAAPAAKPLRAVLDEDVLTQPKYPASAKEAGIGGLVVLEVLIGDDGAPREIKVKRSEPEGVFDAAAVEAAWQWRFNAGRNGNRGQKVEGWVVVPVQFSPDGPPKEEAAPVQG
ncbi:TonB family protein [bacterium BD-1]|uniref:TonB family protein n=1 Tax=Arenimonas sp. TaxID=1872635 RepID=UPI001E65B00C|nr:TonB family protein [Ottowia caeni]